MKILYFQWCTCVKLKKEKARISLLDFVNAAPFLMMVLVYDYTLNNVDPFCTNDNTFSVLGVDPTFSLGDLDVTVTTYKHLMLESRVDSKPPTMIGPMFIHVNKDSASYHFFFSSLIGQQPGLANVNSFGTDSELALANALKSCFPSDIYTPQMFLAF